MSCPATALLGSHAISRYAQTHIYLSRRACGGSEETSSQRSFNLFEFDKTAHTFISFFPENRWRMAKVTKTISSMLHCRLRADVRSYRLHGRPRLRLRPAVDRAVLMGWFADTTREAARGPPSAPRDAHLPGFFSPVGTCSLPRQQPKILSRRRTPDQIIDISTELFYFVAIFFFCPNKKKVRIFILSLARTHCAVSECEPSVTGHVGRKHHL